MDEAKPLPREILGKVQVLTPDDSDPNLPLMLRRRVEMHRSKCLYTVAAGDGYRHIRWEEYLADVTNLARALVQLGLKLGDRVAISSENRYEWRVCDGAILAAGGVVVPLHVGLTGLQAQHEIHDAGCRMLIVSNQGQMDKMAPVANMLGSVACIITLDPARWSGQHEVLCYQNLLDVGAKASASTADEQLQREHALTREDLATIIYTSGTTGVPKGVMLTHDNILFLCDRIRAAVGMREHEVLLNWLPLSHGFGRMADHFTALMAGCRVAMAEGHEVLVKRIADIQPTAMTAVPRIFEKIFALTSMMSPDDQRRKLKSLFGPRMGYLISGGAPLPPVVADVFLNAGVLILEGYGLTETTAISHFNHPDRYRAGTVGLAIPDTEVTIAEDGEVLIRGRHIMKGYWGMPEATAEVMTGDWFHTGDIGCIDDEGFLVITDRKKDLIVNSAGKNIAPQYVESTLAQVPFINQVVVFGDRRQYLSAVIVPEWLAIDKLYAMMEMEKKPPTEAVEDPALIGVMRTYIDEALKDLAPWEQVRKFVLVSEAFSIEGGTLTPTLKVRRKQAYERHQSRIEALYEE